MLRANSDGASWRELAEPLGVNHATLHRFAKSRGEWVPRDPEILERLGLLVERSPYAVMPRWWRRTPDALAAFLGIRGRVKRMHEETRAQQTAWRKK